MDYSPLCYMWVAVYRDNSALPQFDLESGAENHFADIDQSRLKEFRLHPFNFELAKKIAEHGRTVEPSSNPVFTVKLARGDKLVHYRHNKINYGMKGDSPFIASRQTFYILGKEGDKILCIDQKGRVIEPDWPLRKKALL